ncbi:hypothetical protein FM120_18345 [Sphingobacterium faecium PCAi_F2.5]|nr:hypothetical protein FM120_18345 [Sphingobacterium faecium PCAi_F2.5]
MKYMGHQASDQDLFDASFYCKVFNAERSSLLEGSQSGDY